MTTSLAEFRIYNSDEAQLNAYRRRLEIADQKVKGWHGEAKDQLSRYRNEAKVQQFSQQGHRVSVPAILSVVDAMYSGLTATEIDVNAVNRGIATREQAQIAAQALSEAWRETKAAEKAEAAIKDSLIVDIGWVKVGYDFAEETRVEPRSDEDIAADVQNLIFEALQAGEEAPTPDQIAELVPTTEEVTEVLRDRIVVDHVPWDMIRWDPEAKRIEDIRWIAQYVRMHPEEVKANVAFRNFVKGTRGGGIKKLDKLSPDESLAEEEVGEVPRSEADDRITLVEFWDFETGTVSVFPRHGDFFLDQRPNPFAIKLDLIDKNPFVPIVIRSDPENVRGIGDVRVALPSHDELNFYRSELANYLERHKAKIIGPEGGLTEAGRKALGSRTHGDYVETAREVPPGSIVPLVPPPLPQEAFEMEQRIEDSIREATGVNELMRGLFPQRRQTATAIQEVSTQSSVRQAEKRTRLERFYDNIARRVLTLMQLFYDVPRVSRMVGESVEEVWVWDAEAITAELDLEVILTPKEPRTNQERQDNAMKFLNLVLALPDTLVDHREAIRWALEESQLPRDVIETIIRTEEEEEERKQDQLDEMQQQVEIEQEATPAPEGAVSEPPGLA